MEKNYKSGFAALIGRPNVGKSTLMNRLVGQKIAITSSKPQTTRNRIQTVYSEERGQIIFLDTPGLHRAKNKLGEYMVNVAERTLSEVDVLLWLVEPTSYIGAGEQAIAEKLKTVDIPVILVINKIDTVKKEEILKFIEAYRNILDFSQIVPVSALKAENTDRLIDVIFQYLPEGPMYYDEDTVTDQPERQIVAELIREKALRLLSDEIPQRDSHKGIIIGKQGAMLKKIGMQARAAAESLLDAQVNLKLWVKVRKDWRESEAMLKNFGYRPPNEE